MTEATHKVELYTPNGIGRCSTVKLDGKQLVEVDSIDIHVDGDGLAEATIKLRGSTLQYAGELGTKVVTKPE